MAHIYTFQGKTPQIHPSAFVAPTATLIGDVIIHKDASIWFGAVLRGDKNQIVIGARSNIQDNAVLHCNGRFPTLVAEDVTIGHGVIMEGCIIGPGTLVGMNATILSGAIIGEKSLIAAGSVVREGQQYPPQVLLAGVPATRKRELDEESLTRIARAPEFYLNLKTEYDLGSS